MPGRPVSAPFPPESSNGPDGSVAEAAARPPASLRTTIRESTLTCPRCGHAATETMPEDACLWYYECRSCRALLTPRAGDCCVFCSYGSVPCPPVQVAGRDGCCRESRAGATA